MVAYKYCLLLFCCSLTYFSIAQESTFSKFKKLSNPEKRWAILHPFIVKKAYRISVEAQHITDSIHKAKVLDNYPNGGQVDAFRHGYWMLSLSLELGKRRALSLGKAHEKGNKKDFKKGRLEENQLPDAISIKMDLLNNEVGTSITSTKNPITDVITLIKNGDFHIIKRDAQGNFIDANGNIIPTENWHSHWINNRCLVKSNWSN